MVSVRAKESHPLTMHSVPQGEGLAVGGRGAVSLCAGPEQREWRASAGRVDPSH